MVTQQILFRAYSALYIVTPQPRACALGCAVARFQRAEIDLTRMPDLVRIECMREQQSFFKPFRHKRWVELAIKASDDELILQGDEYRWLF
jgi:hypothetical protein